MASKIFNSKCIKRPKGFSNTKQKAVQCPQFSNHLHLKCTGLIKNTHQSFSGDKDFICHYCSRYSCTTCEKHMYDNQDGNFYYDCNLWAHRWCAMISKLQCKCLAERPV